MERSKESKTIKAIEKVNEQGWEYCPKREWKGQMKKNENS